MFPTYTSLAVLTVCFLGHSAAAPACDSSGVLPCIMPLMAFGQSPEAHQIQALQAEGRELAFTARQFTTVCKLVQSLTTCVADYMGRCVEQDVLDVHQFFQGSVKLMEVCDQPDAHSKAIVLMTCNKALNASGPAFKQCVEAGKGRLTYMNAGSMSNPQAAMQILRSGTVLRDICCTVKDSYSCLLPHFRKCSSEALSLNEKVYEAILDAYSCPARIAAGGCSNTA